jgi:hypothetical protein
MPDHKNMDTLLNHLDQGIQKEIQRICDPPLAAFESLLTVEDAVIAKSMGIRF